MSKYCKAEDVEAVLADKHMNRPLDSDRWVIGDIGKSIADLPTIEVSEDCVSREWVKGICEDMLDEEMLGHMLALIEDAPSVVPRRAEGKWVKQGLSPYEGVRRCSLCGNVYNITEDFNYCPNCGAKMKG